jgi:translation initiation factor eIF-2B subunit beta
MPPPGLASYLRSLKDASVEASIERLISFLKRRQLRDSEECARATLHLLYRVVENYEETEDENLIDRIRSVGRRLVAAKPGELVVGNMVRRVLGLVREVAEYETDPDMNEDGIGQPQQPSQDSLQRPSLPSHISTMSPLKHGTAQPAGAALHPEIPDEDPDETAEQLSRPPLLTSHTSYAQFSAPTVTSLFGLFSHPDAPSGTSTPPNWTSSPHLKGLSPQFQSKFDGTAPTKDIKPEVLEGLREILDELDQVDKQIADSALEHIHENEVVLTHTSSITAHKFLLQAAKKRKFTVGYVEDWPNHSPDYHSTLLHGPLNRQSEDDDEEDARYQPLTALGIKVFNCPDAEILNIMSRVSKVILPADKVLANGGFVAAVPAYTIAMAARMHRKPVIVLSGVFKLSPVYPFDIEEFIEYGDANKVDSNPLNDYVPPDLVDLYITNLGGHAPSDLGGVVSEHYNVDDITL